ncbi:Nudix hydrolase 12 [Morus notabilis]|uniref:Nudix hydrolase 12 n=1 Tax=Morus notabilis TaxID=981085 RepID=W9QX23_9ROSA|nr:Nudix hydrolase 12 [Morus notabilis]
MMPSDSVVARKGRQRQRYHNNLRLVSGCIPYRLTNAKDAEDCGCGNVRENMRRIQVLMVSSPNRDDLVFPKGGWEDDETREEAACREALEEAGVRGIIKEIPLGDWEFRSKSKQKMICSPQAQEGVCKGYMFALEVTEVLDTWPEQQNRDRRWLNIKEAFELCRYEWMREALEAFLRVMEADEMRKADLTTEDEKKIAGMPMPDEVVEECQEINKSSSNSSTSCTSTSHHPAVLLELLTVGDLTCIPFHSIPFACS